MGKYSIISSIELAISDLLNENMMTEQLLNSDGISICSPPERGDSSVSLYLYKIIENRDIQFTKMIPINQNTRKQPPLFMSLYFMITAYSNADTKYKAIEEHRILGRVIQILKDNPVIDCIKLGLGDDSIEQNIRISLMPLDMDEVSKIWTFPNMPYKLSLFYKIAPIEIESLVQEEYVRVGSVNLGLQKES